ncbi:hypothetical protein J3R82DRAFT_9712 [Butyriboletus roseoflavus]|nr:hypothetical protein J3R82DRAFT_9712 [Butyriboletus roseoflavus]
MDTTQRRRPTIAKEWQLAVLKKLQSESSNPTERQRSAAAAETGLDEKWVKNWFIRQRSKVAARNRKGQLATSEPRVHSATVPTFKLQLCYPPAVPSGPQALPSRRSVSTPIDPAPYITATSCREPSPASLESRSPHPPRSTVDAQTIHCSHRSVSAPMYLNNPPEKPTLVPHATTIPTYSRDPLCNRYPDFSQFFHPQVHERFRSSELSAPINNLQLLANPNMDSHAHVHIQGLFNLLDPLHLDGLPTHQNSSAYLRSCPVAFSMRLVDLLGHPRLTRYPIFLPSELGDCV